MSWVSEITNGPSRPWLNGPRLRSTWLHEMAPRVPLAVLVQIAGPVSGNTLRDIVQAAPEPFSCHDLDRLWVAP